MSKHRISRSIAVLVGAAVLFGLEQGLGLQLYFAIPVAFVAYILTLAASVRVLGADSSAK
jgi:hypothetical protein